jgi:hypothetical protein
MRRENPSLPRRPNIAYSSSSLLPAAEQAGAAPLSSIFAFLGRLADELEADIAQRDREF